MTWKIAPNRSDFSMCYNLDMEFKDVEKAHQIYKKKVQKHIWISAIIALVVFFAVMSTNSNWEAPFYGIILFALLIGGITAVVVAVVMAFTTRKEATAYRSAYKTYFVEKNLQKTFTDLKYNHEMGLAREVLSSTQMVNTGDVYNSNDLTTGKYKDVGFTQADVQIQTESTDSDGNTTYVTIFKGRFMIFEFPKKFSFRLEVVEKWFGASLIPGRNSQTGRKFEKIEVESDEFNKIFKTYAEDGFEAFYLLDPAFINNILELDQQYKGKLLLGFMDNKLLVGLNDNKDAFEAPGAFKKLDEQIETEKIAREINLITSFIDKLKLDRKLFKDG